jgi:hypothetical protein
MSETCVSVSQRWVGAAPLPRVRDLMKVNQQCGDTAVTYLDILALATRYSCSGMYIYIYIYIVRLIQ